MGTTNQESEFREEDFGEEDWDSSQKESRDGVARHDVARNLQIATSIFVVLLLIGLGGLGWLGWIGTEKAIDLKYVTSAPLIEATPTESSDTLDGQTTPEPSPSPTPSPTPAPMIPRETAQSAATQHLTTLALLTAIAILFPGVLLLAFAVQRVPRLVKDLHDDLKKLGLSGYPRVAERELKQQLIEKIQSGFQETAGTQDPRAFAAWLVEDLIGWTDLSFETPSKPREMDAQVWREVLSLAEVGQQRIWEEREKEEETRIRQQLRTRYGVVEFLLPLLSLTLFMLMSLVWAFWPQGAYGFVEQVAQSASLPAYFSSVVADMSPAIVAVIVSYLFLAYQLVRRYHRSDITPGAYWEVLKRLFVVFLLGLVASVLIRADPESEWAARSGAILIAILAGVFPVGTLGMLARGGQAWLQAFLQWLVQKLLPEKQVQWGADLAQRLRPRHELTLLDDIDQWDVLRIEEEGLIGIQGMAEADIAHLLTWTPFPTSQIVDWVDQAILFLAAGAEPETSYVKTLRAMGLRGASDLIDATCDKEGKLRVVLAAQAVQGAPAEDPIPLAQLAALRAQRKVKDAQEKVTKVKGKKKGESLDKANIESALAAVREARGLVDDAHERVKAGGDTLQGALDAANSLQAKLKTGSEKADEVEEKLKAVTDNQVSEQLEAALKALGDKLAGEPDANSQAQALVDALDKIANPMVESESKAKEFQEKAREIKKKAEAGVQTDVPEEVEQAESILTTLTELAQDAQKRIKADTSLEDAADKVDDLVKLLTDAGEDKPKKLLGDERLKKKEQWTSAGDDNKAKAYEDGQKLFEQAEQTLTLVQAGAKAVKEARAAAASAGAAPVLTMEVLETILRGLERNANLRRVQRYLTEETAEIPRPREYKLNIEWLGGR